ncbi:MAG TPA: phosphoribosylanthranilate isomerase [Bacteroidetes bacterium]|nr:phosphoribosylanthranilate isomerase [Bacteroidota bacterium]
MNAEPESPTATRVKICGITRLEDARYCAAVGADYLGFIQHEESPRYVDPRTAKEIMEWSVGPEPVGVFVNREAQDVIDTCAAGGFTHAQLHGHETPETCAAVRQAGLTVIKSIQVVSDAAAEQILAIAEPYRGSVDHLLLDTHHTSLWGGTGESFNWRLARQVAREWELFLAGGISAENVAEAIQTMRPFAIDLSSSLEESPGVKDFDKLADFFDAFRAALGTEGSGSPTSA